MCSGTRVMCQNQVSKINLLFSSSDMSPNVWKTRLICLLEKNQMLWEERIIKI